MLGDSQFDQLDKSVRTALARHPSLARYFVCVPLDRPDARTEGRKSALERWTKHVSKWEGWAQGSGQEIEFVWWDSSELLERLSRSEHCGRVFFWFSQPHFDGSWFNARLDEAILRCWPTLHAPGARRPSHCEGPGLLRPDGFEHRCDQGTGEECPEGDANGEQCCVGPRRSEPKRTYGAPSTCCGCRTARPLRACA